MASVLANLRVEISANAASFKSELGKANKALDGFGKELKFIGGSIKTFFAANIIGGIGKEIFNTTSQFQKLGAVLTNALGSRSGAQKSLKDIVEFSSKTPFQVAELTQSYVKLVNQGFKPTVNQLRQLGDLAASTGKGFDMLTEAIIDAQTGEFERLKEFGIRASKNGDQVKFTFKGVETQTKFTADAIRDYITSLGDLQGVSGSMAAISGTLEGKLSNLGDNVDRLLTFIGNSSSGLIGGVLDLANDALGALNDALDDQVGALQEEQAELNVLVGAITDVNVSEEVRKQLITELNQKYPDFLKNLDAEKVTNEQLSARLKDVNDQFLRKIALQASEERFKEVQQDILDLIDDEVQVRKKLEEQQIKQNKLQNDSRKGVGVEQGLIRIAAQISLTEKQIESIQKERAKVQKELTDRLIEYDKALGIFNTTNNDYFEGTTKAVEATKKLSVELSKATKFKPGVDGGNETIPGEFVDVDQEFANKLEEQTNQLVKQTEAALGLGAAYGTLSFNYAQWVIDQENAARAADEAAAKMVALGSVLGELSAQIIQGGETTAQRQEQQVRALGNATIDIVDLYFKQSIAAVISESLKIGGPAGLAIAGVGIAAVRALFNKAVGGHFKGGGGAGTISSSPRASISGGKTQDSQTIIVKGQITGTNILVSGQKQTDVNKSTRVGG